MDDVVLPILIAVFEKEDKILHRIRARHSGVGVENEVLNTVVIETNQSTHDRQQCLICDLQSESKEFYRSDLDGVVDMSSVFNNQREIGFDFDAVSSKNNGL